MTATPPFSSFDSATKPLPPQPSSAATKVIISAATAIGNDMAPSDMTSLAPSQLNNANGRSFFIEFGADLTADLPPIAGDPSAGGGLQTGAYDQQRPLAPSYTISTARIKEAVGCLDRSKFYSSWKISLDTAYIKRDTTLAPDATAFPSNPNRSSLATKSEPIYLCSEQLQAACGNSRYFTRFGQAEITEGLYTTAYARFERDLPSNITFQFPCALDLIPDNAEKYYANSPRIEGTRDLSNGRPMAAPYYENQFVKAFNIRFIITVDIGLNTLPVYGRVRAAQIDPQAIQSAGTEGVSFSGPGEAPAGGSVSANVESAQTGFDRVVAQQSEAMKVAQEHIDNLRKISQDQAVKDFAKIGGSTGDKILSAINRLAGAASSAISQATQVAAMSGAGSGLGRGTSAVPPNGEDLFPDLPPVPTTEITIAPLRPPTSSSSSFPTEDLPAPPTSLPLSSAAPTAAPTLSFGGEGEGDINSLIRSDVSTAPTVPRDFSLNPIIAPAASAVSFDELPPVRNVGGAGGTSAAISADTINPFSGTGVRTQASSGISRITASREILQARSFYDYVENGSEFPASGISRPSAIRIKFAQEVRKNIIRGLTEEGRMAPIDPNTVAEAISRYTQEAGGFIPTKANVSFVSANVARKYLSLAEVRDQGVVAPTIRGGVEGEAFVPGAGNVRQRPPPTDRFSDIEPDTTRARRGLVPVNYAPSVSGGSDLNSETASAAVRNAFAFERGAGGGGGASAALNSAFFDPGQASSFSSTSVRRGVVKRSIAAAFSRR